MKSSRRLRLRAGSHITLWLLAVGMLAGAPEVVVQAQGPTVVRGVAASLGGGGAARATGVVGVGVGVELSEHVEVFGEAARGWGIAYPVDPYRGAPVSMGPPVTIVLRSLEWSRYDRLLLGGGRLSTSREASVWVFGEAVAGFSRRTDVLDEGQRLISSTSQVPVVMAGGGLAGRVRRLQMEVAYRIGTTNETAFSSRVNGVHAAVGLRF